MSYIYGLYLYIVIHRYIGYIVIRDPLLFNGMKRTEGPRIIVYKNNGDINLPEARPIGRAYNNITFILAVLIKLLTRCG